MRPARHGAIIPVVLLALIVMAILGTWLMWQSTSNYAQTTRVAANLRCREVLAAAMDEARALAYDNLNRVGATEPLWHRELIAELNRTPARRGVLKSYNLRDALARTREVASRNLTELTSASAELLGFKRLSVDSRGLFEDPRIYYRDERRKLDPPSDEAKFAPPVEWIGHLRIRATAKSGTLTRAMTHVLDVKVVDVNPPAREFVLFSFLPSARGLEHGPTSEDYWRNDLRRGGPMHVFGHAHGRIFVRGPFLVDTVGWTNGTGGRQPMRRTSSNQNVDWYGWATVPANRDGIVARGGPAIVNFGMPPMRPESTGSSRAFVGLVADRFGSSWTDWFNDDPGYYIRDGQRWYCESTGSDASIFSIAGKAYAFNTFRGTLAVYENGGRDVVGTTDGRIADSYIAPPGEPDKRWVIEPEGGLHGEYGVIQYSGSTYLRGAWQRYRVRFQRRVQGRLGLHWEKKYTTGWLDQFVIDLLSGGTILGTIPSLLMTRSVAESISGVLLSLVGLNTRPAAIDALSRLTPDSIANVMPPGYRPPMRSVTRRYRRFSELPGQRTAGIPVVLDGIVAFDELDGTQPFRYAGRGVIYTEAERPQNVVGPIVPTTSADERASLTIHHEGPAARAHEGRAMLSMRGAGTGANSMVAYVYSTQGVKPSGNIRIDGNLTCGFVNKGQFPSGNAVDLHYRKPPRDRLPPVCAVSFRASLAMER